MTGHRSHGDPHIGYVPPETRECLGADFIGVDFTNELLAWRIRAATEHDTCHLTVEQVAARAAELDDGDRADPDVMAMQDWDAAERNDDDDDTIGDGIVLADLTDSDDDVCPYGCPTPLDCDHNIATDPTP